MSSSVAEITKEDPYVYQKETAEKANQYLARHGIGVRELAEMLDCGRSTAHDLLSGRATFPAARKYDEIVSTGQIPRDSWRDTHRESLQSLLESLDNPRRLEPISGVQLETMRKACSNAKLDRPVRRLLKMLLTQNGGEDGYEFLLG